MGSLLRTAKKQAFENTHPAVCSADLASSRNTASISTPQTSQTLPLEVPARVPHKKDDQVLFITLIRNPPR